MTDPLRAALTDSANGLHNFARMARRSDHTTTGWRDCPAVPCAEARAALAADTARPDATRLAVAMNDAQIDLSELRLGRDLLPVAERILAALAEAHDS